MFLEAGLLPLDRHRVPGSWPILLQVQYLDSVLWPTVDQTLDKNGRELLPVLHDFI